MALSNEATPKYYGEFRRKVLSGEIPVCREVSLRMNLIDGLIEDPRYYYDDSAIEGYVNFCEGELTLTDGEPLELLDTFKLWAEDLLAWFYFVEVHKYVPGPNGSRGHYEKKLVKKRLVDKQYLIIARGGAKSMYSTTIQAYFLVIDTTTTKQITTAPTMKQAEEVMGPLQTAIARSRGPLFRFFTSGTHNPTNGSSYSRRLLDSTKLGIQNFLTNSILEIRPMSINKIQGARPKVSTVDEWLSGDTRENVIEALEQGASKIPGWVIVATSSEGTVRNAAGDSIKMDLLKILNGEVYDPHTSIWYYRLDDVKEVSDPEMWVKAQPNIGITVDYETYQRAVERAETNPSVRNDILAKRFGIPMEGYTYFFPYEETKAHRRQNFDGMACSLGADLSKGDDFCAFTFLFPLGSELYGVKTVSYISSRTYEVLSPTIREKYDEFIEEDTLRVLDGVVLDMRQVYEDLSILIDSHRYDIRAFGYDPYNASDFLAEYTAENGSYNVEKVIQGVKTESVPLSELKKLSEDRRLIFFEKLMSWTMGNAIVIEDNNGNRKLLKMRTDAKIDNVAAMMDAWVAYKLHKDEFDE